MLIKFLRKPNGFDHPPAGLAGQGWIG